MQLLLQAAVLGIVQGLTEFLPVSSSAHLILVRGVFGWGLLDDQHWNMIFDVSAHAGTFVALIAYFWSDIWRLVGAFFASLRFGLGDVPDRRLAWILVIATIPAGLAGWLGENAIESFFRQLPMLLGSLLVVFGLVLWAADRLGKRARELGEVGWLDGMLIGCAQALALAPGVSRSGITMTVGLARGLTRETAARFSFLLSLPIIAGAGIFGLQDVMGAVGALPEGSVAAFAMGFLWAAASGYLCIRYFLRYLQRYALAPFIIYRVALGAFLVVWFVGGSVRPLGSPLPSRRHPLRGDSGERRYLVAGGGRIASQERAGGTGGAGGQSQRDDERSVAARPESLVGPHPRQFVRHERGASGRALPYPLATLSKVGASEPRACTASDALRARNAIQLTMLSSFAPFSTSWFSGTIIRPKTVSSMCH